MVKKILNGRIVGVILQSEYSSSQLLRINEISNDKSQYYCDSQGNIYRYDLLKKKMANISIRKLEQRKNVVVDIHLDDGKRTTKRYLVKYLIGLAVFKISNLRADKISHLDGNPLNNKISNLFVDLTVDEIDKNFY